MTAETTIDLDDDILATAQSVSREVSSGTFAARFSSRTDAARAVRDLLAGADALRTSDVNVAFELNAAACAAVDQCCAATPPIEIAAALHEQVLKRAAVAAREAFGAHSDEAVRASHRVASFASRSKPLTAAAAAAPTSVREAAAFSPLGLRCWSERCRAASGATLMSCARCHIALYCSVDCQAVDWRAGHKAQCKQFVRDAAAVAATTTTDNTS
jgi:hypothetical protein